MEFSKEDGRFHITARETVALCTRYASAYRMESPLSLTSVPNGDAYTATFAFSDFSVEMTYRGVNRENGTAVLPVFVSDTEKITDGERRAAHALGFLYAAMRKENGEDVPMRVTLLYRVENDEEITEREDVLLPDDTLRTFLEKVRRTLLAEATPEYDRFLRRKTMSDARFPFPTVRAGQTALLRAAAATMKHGGKLYASAPTGIGKTVSFLYPAIRALGNGDTSQVFYFIPKTTTAEVSAETLRAMEKSGVRLRAVVLSAKEKLCPTHVECRKTANDCPLSRATYGKITEAALRLLSDAPCVATEKEITETARLYKVCPHELSLRYAEFCDVVTADYNYLFDPDVFLRRFFDTPSDRIFLVDEAHTLAERATAIYSASFSDKTIRAVLGTLPEECKYKVTIEAINSDFHTVTADLLRDTVPTDDGGVPTRFAAEKKKRKAIAKVVETFGSALYAAMHDPSFPSETRDLLRTAYYETVSVARRYALYDSGFITFVYETPEETRMDFVCLDPSAAIAAATAKGRAAVFFSGTLSPMHYYRHILGGGNADRTLSAESPFTEDQMAVAVMDTLSVRLREREDTLDTIADAIRRTVLEKCGNYLVFCPSFAYMRRLFEYFRRKEPGTPAIAQSPDMSPRERQAFLGNFKENPREPLVGFCVAGGVFGEGVDLPGSRLYGAVVIGIGLPPVTPEREAMREYYDEKYESGKEYAYLYPGLNRVLQAAGRVIRTTTDRGVILLIDDRYAEPLYRRILPEHFPSLALVGDGESLTYYFRRFWDELPPLPKRKRGE